MVFVTPHSPLKPWFVILTQVEMSTFSAVDAPHATRGHTEDAIALQLAIDTSLEDDEAASLAAAWPWLDDAGREADNDDADNDEADNDEADNAAGQAWMAGQCCWSRLVEAGIQMGWSSSAGWDGGDPAWWQNSSWKSAGDASSPHDEPSDDLLVEEDHP